MTTYLIVCNYTGTTRIGQSCNGWFNMKSEWTYPIEARDWSTVCKTVKDYVSSELASQGVKLDSAVITSVQRFPL